jgi:hypothetical protein
MIICIRYFFEKTEEEHQQYLSLWNENESRMIFLQTDLSKSEQISLLIQDIQNNESKDILAIRFPNNKLIDKNVILERLRNGTGITYNNGIWYPNEIWIYN